MTFKQNSLFLRQFLIFFLLLTVISLSMMLIRAGEGSWMILLCTGAMGLCLLHTWTSDPMITIDEEGIHCTLRDQLQWAFAWSEIAQLRQVTHHRSPAVQIIPVNELPRDLNIPQPTPFYGFQLSRSAKKALETHCPGYRK